MSGWPSDSFAGCHGEAVPPLAGAAWDPFGAAGFCIWPASGGIDIDTAARMLRYRVRFFTVFTFTAASSALTRQRDRQPFFVVVEGKALVVEDLRVRFLHAVQQHAHLPRTR